MREALDSEIQIMKHFNSVQIVKFIDYMEDELGVYIVQEYCDGGDL